MRGASIALFVLALAGLSAPAEAGWREDVRVPPPAAVTQVRLVTPVGPSSSASSGEAAFRAAVLAEINKVRTDPRGYAERLRAYRARYDGDIVKEPGDDIGIQTNEGVAAVDEAIRELERRQPVAPLRANARLDASATRLAQGAGPAGIVGHVGPDGLTPSQRMKAEGVWAGISEENISFGQATAEAVVRQLIIDDGVPGRGHRASLFEAGVQVAGIGCGPHARWGYMCVIDEAGALAER